jgi:hypothetical protein
MEQSYKVISIQSAEAPSGTDSSNWYDYVIEYAGATVVHGCRQGSLKEVTKAVDDIVGQLNERHGKKSGKAKKT